MLFDSCPADLMVGDSLDDAGAAEAAGVRFEAAKQFFEFADAYMDNA